MRRLEERAEVLVGGALVGVGVLSAVLGVISDRPVLATGGCIVLGLVFVDQFVARLSNRPSVLGNFLSARNRREQRRRAWSANQSERAARVDTVIGSADFRSWRDFYGDDPRRRGADVTIREIDEGEFRWRVSWMPTTEVVASPCTWLNERDHVAVVSQTRLRTPTPSNFGVGPAAVPEAIYVLGRVPSADECRTLTSSASTLADVRSVLGRL